MSLLLESDGLRWSLFPEKNRRSGILGTESFSRSFVMGRDVLGCSGLHRVTSCPQSFLLHVFKSMNPSRILLWAKRALHLARAVESC